MKRLALAVLLLALPLAAQERQPAFGETLDVVRYVIPMRVVDAAGHAITDVKASELTATLGEKRAEVESVEWIGTTAAPENSASGGGRLVVLFIQTDFARNSERVRGQLKFNTVIRRVLELLEPEDYVAVVSHDSHLKLQCDFTRDRTVAREAANDAMEIRPLPLPPAPESGPSLARHLNLDEMRNAATPGKALKVLANAMRANEGGKLLMLAGWGIGEKLNKRALRTEDAWKEAMALFRDDHAPVIVLGTGSGGELTAGLMATARETGGTFAATQDFSEQALTRLRGMLSGQYEVVLKVQGELPPGEHAVAVRTSRANVKVLVAPLTVVRATEMVVEEIPEEVEPEPAPVSASRLYIDALQKLREGNAEEAEALLTKSIAMPAAPAESWYERALLRAARGELKQATADLRTYLERAPGGRHAADARDLLGSWQ